MADVRKQVHDSAISKIPEVPPGQIGCGFIGEQRSGKTTTAQALIQRHPLTYKVAFADQVREEVARAVSQGQGPDEYRRVRDDMAMRKELWRPILQVWGTELRRYIYDSHYWITRHRNALINNVPAWAFVVVDDTRFFNEIDYLRNERTWPIVLCQPKPFSVFEQAQRIQEMASGRDPTDHASEVQWRHITPDITLPWTDLRDRVIALEEALASWYAATPRKGHYALWEAGNLPAALPRHGGVIEPTMFPEWAD
jgi:hypothetical protein